MQVTTSANLVEYDALDDSGSVTAVLARSDVEAALEGDSPVGSLADDRRDACSREARERYGRHASSKARLAATAGDMHVAIDEPRNRASAGSIDDARDRAQQGRVMH